MIHPNWILDSIKENKLLMIDKYILYKNSKTISQFFSNTKNNENENNDQINNFQENSENNQGKFFSRNITR